MRLAQSPRELSSSVSRIRCAELARLWLNPIMSIIQSRRDSLDSACRILGTLQTRLVEGCERRLGHRLGLLFVVRRLGHITGQDDLTRPIYTCLGIATVVPALVVGPHDMQLGIRKVALGLVVGAVLQRFRSLAAPFLPRPLALRLSVGSALTLGLRFCLGLRFQPSHGCLDPRQAVLAAGPLRRQVVYTPASPGGLVCPLLLRTA